MENTLTVVNVVKMTSWWRDWHNLFSTFISSYGITCKNYELC